MTEKDTGRRGGRHVRAERGRDERPKLPLLLIVLMALGGAFFAYQSFRPQPPPPPPSQVVQPQGPAVPPPEGQASTPEAAGPSASGPERGSFFSPTSNPVKVVFFSPTKRTFNHRDSVIVVEFDRPMDASSTEAAFSILPSVQGRFSWPNPKMLIFTPSEFLAFDTRYRVSFTDQARDATRRDRLEPFGWSFYTVSSLTFTRDIRPLIAQGCASCHNPAGAAKKVALDAYVSAKGYVVPGDADRSPLYQAFQEKGPHQGLDPAIKVKAYRVQDWINRFSHLD